jgi:hypothetical protein
MKIETSSFYFQQQKMTLEDYIEVKAVPIVVVSAIEVVSEMSTFM